MSNQEAFSDQLNLAGVDPLQNKEFNIRKRDGRLDPFNEQRIYLAIESAFKADRQLDKEDEKLSPEDESAVSQVSSKVSQRVLSLAVKGEIIDVEKVQDFVEDELMASSYHNIAKRYILYRENRRKSRALSESINEEVETLAPIVAADANVINVIKSDKTKEPLRRDKIERIVTWATKDFENCSPSEIIEETIKNLYDGVKASEVDQAMIMASRSRVEREPNYSYVTARILLQKIYRETLPYNDTTDDLKKIYREYFKSYIAEGVRAERLSPELMKFDLEKIASALVQDRDFLFNYLGLQTIYDRYLIHINNRRIETPQYFWMRVAMGLALLEGDKKEEKAIEFYNVLSSFYFTSSTPTLFNSGTCHSQMSSCYLLTVYDDLTHIFKTIADDAQLSKWAGGLGNDWTSVRATGSVIKGTNGESQGVIPFLKVANDTAVAVNQGGKRKGAMCAYLETWHLDIEDFLELRKNTGDERRRTHDMNTANWIPDLFMKRVKQNGLWTLFSPSTAPDLHDLYGQAFEKRYEEYEEKARNGEIKLFKTIEASSLWRRMLTMLFETGHPWITFKDPSNVRSPQSHVGVVHSSNLCTEILLNTSKDEVAVCNLGSINLPRHMNENGEIDEKRLAATIRTGMRMLDNVVDINFYPVPEAKNSNLRHRPVGLGMMGFQDALYIKGVSYESQEAVEFADESMEMISYYAILASSELAKERGTYESYKGSKWDQGYLPLDTIALLEKERGGFVDMDRSSRMNWDPVRDSIKKNGMRNSNTMAIAPTATISNITNVSQSIEPTYKNLYAKSNLSGEFTTINTYLVAKLKELDMWHPEMIDDLKYFDGSVQEIEYLPADVKSMFKTSFEVDAAYVIEAASRRQKWIDMGQSLNLYLSAPSGKRLNDMYAFAWEKGLKTTYYLRATAATQVEKSTLDINRRGLQPRWMKNKSASSNVVVDRNTGLKEDPKTADSDFSTPAPVPKACSIDNPDCESCQ